MRCRAELIGLLIACVTVTSCQQEPDMTSGASVDTSNGAKRFESAGMSLAVEELANTGKVIWALDFIDARTMIFTERQGLTRTLNIDTGEINTLDGGPDVFAIDSGGLFDILVDPQFPSNRQIYWTYIKKIGSHSTTAVARGKLVNNRIIELEDLFIANNASNEHAHWGSRIVMGRDRKLYVSIGERHVPDNAQNKASHSGKILRLNEDGSIPSDNPFVGQDEAAPEIWTYGHRNPQGLAIHPGTGVLFEQEHGPTGGDEINIIAKGQNYGWPIVTYGTNIWGGQQPQGTLMPDIQPPEKYWDPSIAPTGLSFYTGDLLAGWRGDLFSSTLRGPLIRIILKDAEIVGEERLLTDWTDRARDVAEGLDGLIYLATETGRIVRIVPGQ